MADTLCSCVDLPLNLHSLDHQRCIVHVLPHLCYRYDTGVPPLSRYHISMLATSRIGLWERMGGGVVYHLADPLVLRYASVYYIVMPVQADLYSMYRLG